MGSKFCNLNVYSGGLAAVEAQCPGLAARAVVPGWITAAGDDETDWGEVRKLAKRLSKEYTVLYTEYFDDDYVDFSVYREGRRSARHVPAEYEGAPRAAGKPRAWAELFGLSPEMEKALRTVFQETSPERSLRLLECVLGCPLWVDGEFLADAQPPEPDCLRDYLAQKAAERKIKNATKLTLLDEQVGDFDYTYPQLRWEDGDRKSIWAVRDGKLRRLFEAELPGRVSAASEGEGEFLLVLNQAIMLPEEDSDGTDYRNHYWAYFLSEDGTPGTPWISGKRLRRWAASWIGTGSSWTDCYDLRAHRREWSLEEGLTVIDRDRPCCRLAGAGLPLLLSPRRGGAGEELPYHPSCRTFLEQVTRELPEDYWGSGILAAMGTGCC